MAFFAELGKHQKVYVHKLNHVQSLFSLKLQKTGRFMLKLVTSDGKIVYSSDKMELSAGEHLLAIPISEGVMGSLFLSVEGEKGFLRTVKVR
jgi:hypothetical protein